MKSCYYFRRRKNEKWGSYRKYIRIRISKKCKSNIKLIGGDIDIMGLTVRGSSRPGGDISIELYKGRLDAITDGGEVDKNTEGIIRAHSLGND